MAMSEGKARVLGARFDGHGTNFAVYSSVADQVDVCFFDDGGRERRFALLGKTGNVWHGHFDDIAPGQRYGFRVYGPWAPHSGQLCLPEKLLLDPRALAYEGGVSWADALFPVDPEDLDAEPNRDDTARLVPKSVVVDTAFDWQDDRAPGTPIEETVIYEVHVKGFTARHPDIPEALRGTYAGLAHPVAIAHLVGLGVTAVELLPVLQFVHRRRLVDLGLRNYWGYDPVGFFAPHNEYASDTQPGAVVREFKEMVRSLHAAGIEVILDVVFNHTAEGNHQGAMLSFKGIDNAAHYRLDPDDRGRYLDVTGTQNTLDAAKGHVRNLVVESLRYWSTEMHVDGFRFDLLPVLARVPEGFDFAGGVFEIIRNDPALSAVKLIAEPWDVGRDGYQLGRSPEGWSEWNDRFRDDVRSFWKGEPWAVGPLPLRVDGSPDVYDLATQTINFVTCHDGFTLHDLVTYEAKHNEANGEDNRDGHDDNRSCHWGVEGETDDASINALRARQKRNFVATVLFSRGVPMLLSGDEVGRTQRGNNTAYCQDNETTWIDWQGADADLCAFVRQVAALRRRHLETLQTRPVCFNAEASPSPLQRDPQSAGALQVYFDDKLLLLFNARSADTAFTLPGDTTATWQRLVDTAASPAVLESSRYASGTLSLSPHSMVVLLRRAAEGKES
jgi:isoamylase